MSILTIECIVEKGKIQLKTNILLPDKTKVYVVILEVEIEKVANVFSPRLVHSEQLIDFEMG